jgi:membrane-associated protein
METIEFLLQYILHIDTHLIAFVTAYGTLTYIVLFSIIFCETGLVIIPFLPGDSLLFAAGSIASNVNHVLDIKLLFILLTLASILGNKLNYIIGKLVGPKVFSEQHSSWLLNKKHLQEAHLFYEKHGGKTIILARYLPIIRTFVPFIAGIANMGLRQFSFYNLISAILWIGSLLGAGYFFGSLPIVRDHFSIVIYGIIGLSILPPIIIFLYRKIRPQHKLGHQLPGNER